MANNKHLIIAFRLLVRDRIEHEKTVLKKLDILIDNELKPSDKDVPRAIGNLCKKFNIDYEEVIRHALEMYDDS